MNKISRNDMLKKTVAYVGGGAVLLNLPIDAWARPYKNRPDQIGLGRGFVRLKLLR